MEEGYYFLRLNTGGMVLAFRQLMLGVVGYSWNIIVPNTMDGVEDFDVKEAIPVKAHPSQRKKWARMIKKGRHLWI